MKKNLIWIILGLLLSGCVSECIGEPEAMIREQYPDAEIKKVSTDYSDFVYHYHYKFIADRKVVRKDFDCKAKYKNCVQVER